MTRLVLVAAVALAAAAALLALSSVLSLLKWGALALGAAALWYAWKRRRR